MMLKIHILAAIRFEALAKYREYMIKEEEFEIIWVPTIENLQETLADQKRRIEVLVVDNALGDVHDLIDDLRRKYPRLLIILVDEDADFALPGRADEISTNPFQNDQLIRLIKRVYEDRRLVTLRADALPPVREFAKKLMKAQKGPAKIQAAVDTIFELGFDYVGYYVVQTTDPPGVSLTSQAGDEKVKRIAPQKLDYNESVVGLVAQDGQSRIIGKDDTPNHPFVARGKYGKGVCVAVGTTIRFGVIIACKEVPEMDEQSTLMMELVSAQLSSALAREARG
jgi:hypothetical protein